MASKFLPLFVFGRVVKGFGRGSKELGIPTANLSEEVIDLLPKELELGIYYGYASVSRGPVYKMVLSVGWNPFFHNEKKSLETHILHEFGEDFYGSILKIMIVDYIRPEMNFSSLDDLIKEIKNDIHIAATKLEEQTYAHFHTHKFWSNDSSEEKGVFKVCDLEPATSDSSAPKNGPVINGNA